MSVNQPFAGAELNALMCDKFAIRKIDQDALVQDVDLFDTKWWDYRTMHPTQATLYFHHVFKTIAPTYVSKYVDMDVAKGYEIGITRNDLRLSKLATIRAFWKARQIADAIGVPYDVYIKVALQHFYDNYRMFATTKSGKQNLPYPSQMASAMITEKVIKEWEAIKSSPGFSRLPESDLILGQDIWFRDDMEKSIINQFKSKSNPRTHVANAIKKGILLRPK